MVAGFATAVGLARGGSVPELEPISIPDFELMIEHSAPSWLPTPEEESATPGSELKDNKTLPVQLQHCEMVCVYWVKHIPGRPYACACAAGRALHLKPATSDRKSVV